MTTPPIPPERKPHIALPPSKADVDQVSQDQALIADEWAAEPERPTQDTSKPA